MDHIDTWRGPIWPSAKCLLPCDACDYTATQGMELISKRTKAERAAEPSPLRGPEWPHLEVR